MIQQFAFVMFVILMLVVIGACAPPRGPAAHGREVVSPARRPGQSAAQVLVAAQEGRDLPPGWRAWQTKYGEIYVANVDQTGNDVDASVVIAPFTEAKTPSAAASAFLEDVARLPPENSSVARRLAGAKAQAFGAIAFVAGCDPEDDAEAMCDLHAWSPLADTDNLMYAAAVFPKDGRDAWERDVFLVVAYVRGAIERGHGKVEFPRAKDLFD